MPSPRRCPALRARGRTGLLRLRREGTGPPATLDEGRAPAPGERQEPGPTPAARADGGPWAARTPRPRPHSGSGLMPCLPEVDHRRGLRPCARWRRTGCCRVEYRPVGCRWTGCHRLWHRPAWYLRGEGFSPAPAPAPRRRGRRLRCDPRRRSPRPRRFSRPGRRHRPGCFIPPQRLPLPVRRPPCAHRPWVRQGWQRRTVPHRRRIPPCPLTRHRPGRPTDHPHRAGARARS